MEITYPQHHAQLQSLLGKLSKESPGPIGVFVRLRGPASVYGCRACESLEQFQALAVSQPVTINA